MPAVADLTGSAAHRHGIRAAAPERGRDDYDVGTYPDPAHPMSGMFEFHDPRPAAAAMPLPGFDFGSKFLVRPTAGVMLVFPSWHLHMVHPFFGTGERISIAFNIQLLNFEIVD